MEQNLLSATMHFKKQLQKKGNSSMSVSTVDTGDYEMSPRVDATPKVMGQKVEIDQTRMSFDENA